MRSYLSKKQIICWRLCRCNRWCHHCKHNCYPRAYFIAAAGAPPSKARRTSTVKREARDCSGIPPFFLPSRSFFLHSVHTFALPSSEFDATRAFPHQRLRTPLRSSSFWFAPRSCEFHHNIYMHDACSAVQPVTYKAKFTILFNVQIHTWTSHYNQCLVYSLL